MRHLILAALVATALGAAAAPHPAQAQTPARVSSSAGPLLVETAAAGLENPWGLAFLPDGRMLVTERAGRLRVVSANGQLSQPLGGLPRIAARGQGGLLDVALDPAFAENRLVYLSFAEPREGGGASTSVARARLNAAAPRWRMRPSSSSSSRRAAPAGISARAWSSGGTGRCS